MSSSRDLLLLTIETLTENAFDVIMHRKALVEDLKLRIRYITGIEPTDQHILLGSIELKDEMSLEHYRLETGSKLRLVTSMRGGPISFRKPSPVPPFVNLTSFLLSATEPDTLNGKSVSKRKAEENTNDKGQPVAYYIIHDGVVVKITEFDSDMADEESASFLNRMSKDALSRVSKMEDEEEMKRLIENERTKEKMKNLRKNMEHASDVREKLKAKRMSRPEPPRFNSPSPGNKETTNSISTANSRRSTKMLGKRSTIRIDPSDDPPQRGTDQDMDRLMPLPNMQRAFSGQRQFKDTLKVTPMHILGKQNQKFAQGLPIVSHSTNRDYDDPTTHTKGGKSAKRDRKGMSMHYRDEHQRSFYFSNESDAGVRPTYIPGFLGSNFERFINEEEFMRQTRSTEERGRSMDYALNAQQGHQSSLSSRKFSAREDQRRSRESRGSSAVRLDSLIALMAQTIMGTSRRSFERRSSSRNKIGLTSRRFTHDGRTNEPKNPSPGIEPTHQLPSLKTTKLSIGPTDHTKAQKEQRPLGMVTVDRCAVCNKKLGIATSYKCRCSKMLCMVHKFPEEHQCEYDYKRSGREQIKKNNPTVDGNKLNKI